MSKNGGDDDENEKTMCDGSPDVLEEFNKKIGRSSRNKLGTTFVIHFWNDTRQDMSNTTEGQD